MVQVVRRLGKALMLLGVCLPLLAGCALFAPLPAPTDLEQRLAQFPTEGLPLAEEVTIRWNAQQIPFIEAEDDGDAAFALGLVHAHLRLGQMAVVRRILQGRLSESAGPLTIDLDHAIRTFDFYRSAPEILAAMPPETRRWFDRYVEGINHYAAGSVEADPPHEFAVLNIAWEPWRPEDTIALGRAAGIDLNWGFLFSLLAIEDPDLRQRVAQRVLDDVGNGKTSYALADTWLGGGDRPSLRRFAELAAWAGRSGSNSFALAAERSASGAPLIANDPHLAFIFPNAWVVAGLRSPSYAMVGMMVAGTPVFGFGRNEHVAWGGTNLRARTSQLVDVSGLPPEQVETLEQEIAVRFWPDVRRSMRLTPYGPIVSDLDLLEGAQEALAIRWTGHTVTDELTALLAAMRATSVAEFRSATAGFAFPPQTFVVVDSAGQIGSVIATKVPARQPGGAFELVATPDASDRDWADFTTGAELPAVTDPAEGFIASANNRPAEDGSRPFGGVFPQDERIRRLAELLEQTEQATLDELVRIQLDVTAPLSLQVIDVLRGDLSGFAPRDEGEALARTALLEWDGAYRAEETGPAIFEAFLTALAPAVYETLGQPEEFELYLSLERLRPFLIADLETMTPEQRRAPLADALAAAGGMAASGQRWGDIHRLRVAHVLGRLPLLGGRYEIETIGVSGSRETVMKTSHPLTDGEHETPFGAQSRHISDMADPDLNYFVLLGGQDGRINSTTFADQVQHWRDGRLIQVPLTPAAVAASFPYVTALAP